MHDPRPLRRFATSCLLMACAASGLALASQAPTLAQEPTAKASLPPIADGPFKPERESMKQYTYPDWFRDAKLGIWAHWGPQAVPMMGDWYARRLYIEGDGDYKDHLARFGHPSKLGYKDIIPLWKAEKWDPDRLMALYKKAGAKYFVSMGSHHDNFYLWNSKLHKWNAVNMGPHRDVVGDWQKAAQKLGLRFGVSEHLGASFTWFQVSHGADKKGDLAGVPYDGANPEFQDLYHFPAEPGDTGWYSKNPKWQGQWFARIKELVDNYHPDLLYTDGGVPFSNEVGLSMIAHLYNSSVARNNGKVDVIYTCKEASEGRWVEDLERGVMPGVRPYPWQTDTSIGDWFYNKNWKFRGADWVIQMLVDIVAKNGNLLINVVQRPDGSLDPEAEQILADMADWIAINGEAIYGTRPFLVHGEGKTKAKGGHFNEDYKYSAADVRFTTKGDTLYAFIMGWPEDHKVTIHTLAKFPGVTAKIKEVKMLGGTGTIPFVHNEEGLTLTLPEKAPCKYAIAFKITGEDLRGFKPEMFAPPVQAVFALPTGDYTLNPEEADLKGSLKPEAHDGQPNIGFWDNAGDTASWKVQVSRPGKFDVKVSTAAHAEVPFVIEVDGQKLEAKAPATGSFEKFQEINAGCVEFKKAAAVTLTVHSRDAQSWKAINLRAVKLTKAAK